MQCPKKCLERAGAGLAPGAIVVAILGAISIVAGDVHVRLSHCFRRRELGQLPFQVASVSLVVVSIWAGSTIFALSISGVVPAVVIASPLAFGLDTLTFAFAFAFASLTFRRGRGSRSRNRI